MHILKGKKILLGITGSIAAYKACELIRLLVKNQAEVQVVLTEAASHFVGEATFEALTRRKSCPKYVGLFQQHNSSYRSC